MRNSTANGNGIPGDNLAGGDSITITIDENDDASAR